MCARTVGPLPYNYCLENIFFRILISNFVAMKRDDCKLVRTGAVMVAAAEDHAVVQHKVLRHLSNYFDMN